MVPYCRTSLMFDDDDGTGNPYEITTLNEKLVYDYSGVPIDKQDELNIFTFWGYLRDAVIYLYNQTEKGREYLQDCWCSEQTKADRKKLRQVFGHK